MTSRPSLWRTAICVAWLVAACGGEDAGTVATGTPGGSSDATVQPSAGAGGKRDASSDASVGQTGGGGSNASDASVAEVQPDVVGAGGMAAEAAADRVDATETAMNDTAQGSEDGAPAVVDATADATDTGADALVDASNDQVDACVPTGAEDCYNGLDDDCNGSVDCADAACTPIAECVPEAPNFALGTAVGSAAACPTFYEVSGTALGQGAAGTSICTGCTCSPLLACSATITDFGASACPGAATGTSWDLTSFSDGTNTCTTGPPSHVQGSMNITSGKIKVGAMAATSTCSATGTPAREPADFTTKTKFCETVTIGKGCAPGAVCVPKIATKHCAIGVLPASCPSGYAPEAGGTWYTSINDQRSCGSQCTCTKGADGTCGTSAARVGNDNITCALPSNDLNPGTDNCLLSTTGYKSGMVVQKNVTLPTCSVGNVATGLVSGLGPGKLCCL